MRARKWKKAIGQETKNGVKRGNGKGEKRTEAAEAGEYTKRDTPRSSGVVGCGSVRNGRRAGQ